MTHSQRQQDVLDELLADQALEGLTPVQELELEAMVAAGERDQLMTLAMTASVLELALLQSADLKPMPDAVRQRLEAAGRAWAATAGTGLVPERVASTSSPVVFRRLVRSWGPWVAAVAGLALAALAWWPAANALDPIAMAEKDPNKVVVQLTAWKGTDQADSPDGATLGQVCWSESAQCGYLKLAGLAQNDPCKKQYQLWIIDERGIHQRVSGCVFDCKCKGEFVVVIRPAIPVHAARGFAITMEKTGGTWVSDLSHKVAIAKLRKP